MSAPPPRRRVQSFSDIKPVVLQRSPSVPPLSPTDTMVMAPPPGFSIAGLAAALDPSAPSLLPQPQPQPQPQQPPPPLPPPPESEPAPTLVLVRRSPSAPSALELEVVGAPPLPASPAASRAANARTLIGLPRTGAANEEELEAESAPVHALALPLAPAPPRQGSIHELETDPPPAPSPSVAPPHAAAPGPSPAPARAAARPRAPARAAMAAYRPWPRWTPIAVFAVFVALSVAELLVAYALRP